MNDADVLIVGAGCAGLSLACALSARAPHTPVRLLEPRASYGADRTWCFWDIHPHRFEGSVAHRWRRWRVRAHGREIVRQSDRYAYCHVPGERFYADAQARLGPNTTLQLSTRVSSVVDEGGRVRVEAGDARWFGRVVVDTRHVVPAPEPRLISLVQHFRGWFVRTDRPAFDPTTVTLMDFDVSQQHGLHFMYVLPFAADHALVESTYFTPGTATGALPLPEEAYDESVARYLRDECGLREEEVQQVRVESGAIAMTNVPAARTPSARVLRAGVAAGVAKPSTGYAFAAIQRSADALASAVLVEPPGQAPTVRSPWTCALDEVLLSRLARAQDAGPALFLQLFERVPTDVLVRFLSDASSLREDLQVMRRAPLAAMTLESVRALMRYFVGAS